MRSTVPRPAAAPAPAYTWTGVSAATRQAIELERPAMLREIDQAVTAEEYWLSDETYSGDPATEISVKCVGLDGSQTVVALKWDPARRAFSRL